LFCVDVSTLLEILAVSDVFHIAKNVVVVSTLLEILVLFTRWSITHRLRNRFQPFLRFWGLCIRFLWVFKFFFGFL